MSLDRDVAGNRISRAKECPECGSFMVTTHRPSGAERGSQAGLKSLHCIDCNTVFSVPVEPVARSRSLINSPFWVSFGVLGTVVLAYLFLVGDSKSPSNTSSLNVDSPSEYSQATVTDDEPAIAAELVATELMNTDQPAARLNSQNVDASGNDPRSTGLYDKQVEIVAPSSQALARAESILNATTEQSQAQLERVGQVLSQAETEEQLALLRLSAAQTIERWRSAWERGDFDAYRDAYVDQYSTDKMSHGFWLTHRRSRVTQNLPRTISLEGFESSCVFESLTCTVEFTQRFDSQSFLDVSRKQLVLESRNADTNAMTALAPEFKIVAELAIEPEIESAE